MQTHKFILASSSIYRHKLLAKLHLSFKAESPDIDEILQLNENPDEAAIRLATAKAKSLDVKYPEHFIIGSDQIAILNGRQLSKPGTRADTIEQLQASSGKKIEFFTGICLLNSRTGIFHTDLDKCTVFFKTLTSDQIDHYVDMEKPYDCAGGFKSEGLGIALFERIESSDPNSLVGLPLIKLISLLNKFGINVI
jgi:MAF protein